MNKFIKVENNPGLVRDAESNAIINVDEEGYKAYKRNKQSIKQKLFQEQAKEARINKLESDVSDLKAGVAKILEILTNANN